MSNSVGRQDSYKGIIKPHPHCFKVKLGARLCTALFQGKRNLPHQQNPWKKNSAEKGFLQLMKNYVWQKRNFFDETIILLFGAVADSLANKLKKKYKINSNISITINQIYQN